MKNALKYGIIIGIISVIWILLMHLLGYTPDNVKDENRNWLEFTSILIPFFGLYYGIKKYRTLNENKLTFFEGIFEGFKIILIGGFISALGSIIYLTFFTQSLIIDYMERMFGAVVIGILFTLVNALILMNTPKDL